MLVIKSHYIYSSEYDFSLPGISRLHHFDGHKFSKAWKLFTKNSNIDLEGQWMKPENEVSNNTLQKIHTGEYLESINRSNTIAQVIEIRPARFIPNNITKTRGL